MVAIAEMHDERVLQTAQAIAAGAICFHGPVDAYLVREIAAEYVRRRRTPTIVRVRLFDVVEAASLMLLTGGAMASIVTMVIVARSTWWK